MRKPSRRIFAGCKLWAPLCLLLSLWVSGSGAQTQPTAAPAQPIADSAAASPSVSPAKKSSRKPPSPTTNSTEAEIAAAKASGKVWVNTETRKYHSGGRWYGRTKQGKFMTVDEAKKQGYVAAKNE
jgi:hypothetical protein